MAEQYDLLEFLIPSSSGNATYSSTKIADWDFALVVAVEDDPNTRRIGARMQVSAFVKDATATPAVASVGQSMVVVDAQTSSMQGRSILVDHPNCVILLDDSVPTPQPMATGEFVSAQTNGFTLNWTITANASGRTLKMFVLFIGGLANENVESATSGTSIGFQPDAVLGFSPEDATLGSDGHMAIGFSDNRSPIVQSAFGFLSARAVTSDVATEIHSSKYATHPISTADFRHREITAYTSTGFNDTSDTGAARGHAAFQFSSAAGSNVVIESLDGTTGIKSFTGLGFPPSVIVGVVTGNTSLNTPQAGSEAHSVFVIVGSSVMSATVSVKHGVTVSPGTPSEAYTDFSNSQILAIDASGADAFVASLNSINASGFSLNITTGLTGKMLVWGIQGGDIFETANETEAIQDQSGWHAGGSVEDQMAPSDEAHGVVVRRVFFDNPELSVADLGIVQDTSIPEADQSIG